MHDPRLRRATYVLIIKDVEALAIVVLPATYTHRDEFVTRQLKWSLTDMNVYKAWTWSDTANLSQTLHSLHSSPAALSG